MMEVQRHSIHGARRSEKKFSPEGGGLPPPVGTGLSLGVNGGRNTNSSAIPSTEYLSSVTSTRTPLPNATVGSSFETQSPYDKSAAVNTGGPNIPTPPLVPVEPPPASAPAILGFGPISVSPQDVTFELGPEKDQIALGPFNQNFSRDIPSTEVLADIGKVTRDAKSQVRMQTEPDPLGGLKPDLNVGYPEGETQVISDSPLQVDGTQPALGGETQPVDDEGFDDLVMLQNDTLTASTMSVENGALLYDEPLQIVNTPPLEAPLDATISTPTELKPSSVIHEEHSKGNDIGVQQFINELSSGAAEPFAIGEEANAGPAVISEQARKKKELDTPEPQVGVVQDSVARKVDVIENKGDQSTPADATNAGNINTKKKEVVTQQDIQAITGRNVMKKFGSKDYKGEVVDFDSENQWFKVVYEDGDVEDLELAEVKGILIVAGNIISETPTAKRKKPLPKGGTKKQARKHTTKAQDSEKPRGRPKKKDSSTQTKNNSRKVNSIETSRTKSTKNAGAETEPQLQPAKKRGKRKRTSDVDTEHSTRTGAKVKKGGKNRLGAPMSSTRKTSPKKGGRQTTRKDSSKKEGARRRSSYASTDQQNRGKRRKIDASEDLEPFIGRIVMKEFDGILYKGKVTKFDRKTEYFKVKYEDGDQEDLELEELKAVLVE